MLESEPYREALYNAGGLLVEAGFSDAKELLHVESEFDVVPAWTLAKLRGYSKQLAFLVVDREKEALTLDLEAAIAKGESTRELTARIATTFADGYHVLKDGVVTRRTNVADWSRMVARTEMTRAQTLGATSLYQAAGIQKVQWSASLSVTTCEECSEADGEVVNLGDDFPDVDVDQPPAHPNCACAVVPADEELGSFEPSDEERKTAARGGYSADEFTQHFGFPHPADAEDSGE